MQQSYVQETNAALLSLLLGKVGESLAKRPLAELFGMRSPRQAELFSVQEASVPYAVTSKLMVARELLRRAMNETMTEIPVTLSSPTCVSDYLRLHLAGRQHECFMVLWFDAQNRLLAAQELFRGTLSQTSVYPREVAKEGLRFNAAAAIFCHNHPSGIADQSRADESITANLKTTLAFFDIKVLDHVIVGETSVMSFAERGLL